MFFAISGNRARADRIVTINLANFGRHVGFISGTLDCLRIGQKCRDCRELSERLRKQPLTSRSTTRVRISSWTAVYCGYVPLLLRPKYRGRPFSSLVTKKKEIINRCKRILELEGPDDMSVICRNLLRAWAARPSLRAAMRPALRTGAQCLIFFYTVYLQTVRLIDHVQLRLLGMHDVTKHT